MSESDGRRVSNVATSAIAAGWRPDEVAAALVELADLVMLAMVASRSVEIDVVRRG